MKYYTKEWYKLMQCPMNIFKKIPDGNYTAEDIKALHDKKLKKEIAAAKKDYNMEPFFLDMSDQLTEEAFDPEDWINVDDNGHITRPQSAAEVRAMLEKEKQEAAEEFNNRPPFDPAETIEIFENMYKSDQKACVHNYPEWLVNSVDHRLIALEYLPETAYNRYKAELSEQHKKWDRMNQAAVRALSRIQVPERIEEALTLHDAALLSLKMVKKDLVMVVRKDGEWPDEPTPYRKVIFKDAVIMEQDQGLKPRKYQDEDDEYTSNISYLYNEVYGKEGDFEVHQMFWKADDLQYLTVKCTDVTYEDGITV